MNKLLFLLLISILPFCSFAQKKGFKLVEKSSDKPEWVTQGSVKGFIIVQSDKPTLEQAKTDAMQKVRAEIAESVATNVQRTVNSYSQKTIDNGNSSSNKTLTIESVSKIANMPAIQGVSITKADTYHEIYRNKKSGESYCLLYVKYPFSQFDLVELVSAYESHEKEIDDRIQAFEDGLETFESVDDVNKSIMGLSSLSKELGQEDYRIERINGLIKRYNHVYECIVVEIVSNTPGKLVVRLVCDGKSITTSQMPRLSSNCANQFSTRLSGNNIVIEYNSDYCYAQDDNFIDLRFKFGTKFVNKQVSFKLK